MLAAFEVEVFHAGAGVGVRSVETYTLQCRCYEAEVALVGQFYTHQVGITRILGLCEAGVDVTLILIVGAHLVYDEVVYLLVEDAGAYQTDAAEVIVGTQVKVVGDSRFQLGVSDGDFVVGTLNVHARYEGRVFGAGQGLSKRTAHFEVIVHIPLYEQRR